MIDFPKLFENLLLLELAEPSLNLDCFGFEHLVCPFQKKHSQMRLDHSRLLIQLNYIFVVT